MPNTIYHSYSPYAAQVLPTMDFMPNPPPTIMEAERAILQDLAGEGGQITTGRMKKGSGGCSVQMLLPGALLLVL